MLIPEIISHGGPRHLSPTVVVPSAFRAIFPGDPSVSVEVEVSTDGQIEVREVTVHRAASGLQSSDLRLPLQSKYLPAAVAAACMTLIGGSVFPGATKRITGSLEGLVGVVGPIVVTARIARDSDVYKRASGQPQRGRPRHLTPETELARIAEVYLSSGGSTSAVMAQCFLTKATAHRRIIEARKAGFIGPRKEV